MVEDDIEADLVEVHEVADDDSQERILIFLDLSTEQQQLSRKSSHQYTLSVTSKLMNE